MILSIDVSLSPSPFLTEINKNKFFKRKNVLRSRLLNECMNESQTKKWDLRPSPHQPLTSSNLLDSESQGRRPKVPIIPSSYIGLGSPGGGPTREQRPLLPEPVFSTQQPGQGAKRAAPPQGWPRTLRAGGGGPFLHPLCPTEVPASGKSLKSDTRLCLSNPTPVPKCLLGTKGWEQEDNNICFPNKPATMRIWGVALASALGPAAPLQLRKQLALCHFSERLSPNQRLLACLLYPCPGSHRCSPQDQAASLLAFYLWHGQGTLLPSRGWD